MLQSTVWTLSKIKKKSLTLGIFGSSFIMIH